MKQYVNGVVRSCFQHLRQLRSTRRSVPSDALRTLVHLISTDCNAVQYGVTVSVIQRLQAVLHASARLITGERCNQHIAHRRSMTHYIGCRRTSYDTIRYDTVD